MFLSPDDLRRRLRGRFVPLTPSPGARSESNLPTDPTLVPLDAMPNPLFPGTDGVLNDAGLDVAEGKLMGEARAIADPLERSIALDKTARTKIFARQYDDAHTALVESSQAAMLVRPGLRRDLRLMGISTRFDLLAHEYVQEALVNDTVGEAPAADRPEPAAAAAPGDRAAPAAVAAPPADEVEGVRAKTWKERETALGRARDEWNRAAALAAAIESPNFRSEQLYWVIDSESVESRTIANVAERASTERVDLQGHVPGLLDFADGALAHGAAVAKRISRDIWRDRALANVVANATASGQFARALEVVRMIPDAEIRGESLTKIAEGLARRNIGPEATSVYAEAARSVAEIRTEDNRGVIGGVLIDSLIAVGRFEDARACIPLLPDRLMQFAAWGAVAESQGRRGLAESARRWIAQEAPPAYRDTLYQRVDSGLLTAVDLLRTQRMNRTGEGGEWARPGGRGRP
jgi:hypothetical protein